MAAHQGDVVAVEEDLVELRHALTLGGDLTATEGARAISVRVVICDAPRAHGSRARRAWLGRGRRRTIRSRRPRPCSRSRRTLSRCRPALCRHASRSIFSSRCICRSALRARAPRCEGAAAGRGGACGGAGHTERQHSAGHRGEALHRHERDRLKRNFTLGRAVLPSLPWVVCFLCFFLGTDWRALALTQVHHGSRLSALYTYLALSTYLDTSLT